MAAIAAFLIKHFTKIAVSLDVWITLESAGCVFPIHIAKRDDVLRAHLPGIACAHSAYADAGDVKLVAGRSLAAPSEHMTWNNGKSRRCYSGVS